MMFWCGAASRRNGSPVLGLISSGCSWCFILGVGAEDQAADSLYESRESRSVYFSRVEGGDQSQAGHCKVDNKLPKMVSILPRPYRMKRIIPLVVQ